MSFSRFSTSFELTAKARGCPLCVMLTGHKKIKLIIFSLPSESKKGTLFSDSLVVNMRVSQMEELRLLGVA